MDLNIPDIILINDVARCNNDEKLCKVKTGMDAEDVDNDEFTQKHHTGHHHGKNGKENDDGGCRVFADSTRIIPRDLPCDKPDERGRKAEINEELVACNLPRQRPEPISLETDFRNCVPDKDKEKRNRTTTRRTLKREFLLFDSLP